MEADAKKELDQLIDKILAKEGLNLNSLTNSSYKELSELNRKLDQAILTDLNFEVRFPLGTKLLSEFDFNLFADSVNEVFWLRDKTGKKLLFVNKAYEKVFGKSCQSLYKNPESFLDIVFEEDIEKTRLIMGKLNFGEGYEVDYRIKKNTNETAWIRSRTMPIFDDNNQLYGYSGFAIDITDLKKSEIKLVDSNRYFEEAGSMAQVGSYNLDFRTNILTWSRVTKEIHEVDMDFEPKLSEAMIFYEEGFSRDDITRAVNFSIETGAEFDLELIIITAKGNRKWVRAIGRTEMENGKCVRLFGTFQDIQKIKEFEKGIKIERDRLANVLEGTMAGTWEWDIVNGITLFNERWAQIVGYTLEELRPSDINTWRNLVHPEDLKLADISLEKYFNGEREFYEAEFRMKHKNGNWVWVLDRAKAFKWDENGRPILMAGTHQDITERKLVEEQLQKFSIAIEQSPASIVITNLKGEIEYVNPYFTQITGYSFEEAIGQNPRILKSGDKSNEDYAELWSCLTMGKQWKGEFKNLRKNGQEYWESASISPLHNELGVVTHFIAVKEEITYKKKVEQMLKASEEKYRSIFKYSPFGMATVESSGKVVMINKKLEQLLGYPIDEITDIKSWMELVIPDKDYREKVYKERNRIFLEFENNGIPADPMEVQLLTKNKEEKTFELSHVIIGDYQLTVFNDISERNTHMKALEKQNEILREISWIQSHVVRAPLARLMGLFEFIEKKEFDMIDEQELLVLMRKSMIELDDHIKDISQKAYLVKFLADKKVGIA